QARRARHRPDPHGVPAARPVPAPPAPGDDAVGDLRERLGLRLRAALELARGLHGLPAPQDRGFRRASPAAHGARRGLRAERGLMPELLYRMSFRRRLLLAGTAAVGVAILAALGT